MATKWADQRDTDMQAAGAALDYLHRCRRRQHELPSGVALLGYLALGVAGLAPLVWVSVR